MTKADIVAKIADRIGMEKNEVQATVETFMEEVKTSLEGGENVYLRGFGSFIIKERAEKLHDEMEEEAQKLANGDCFGSSDC